MSPGDRMQLALQSAVSAGTVKSADQSALSGALDDIDAAMTGGTQSAASTDPASMKQKVNALIDQDVSDGKLTDDQASELKKVFADATRSMHHAGRSHHGGGRMPSLSTDDSTDSTDPLSATTASATTASTTSSPTADDATKAIDTLVSFLQQLEKSVSSSSTYSATGASTASASTASSLLIDGDA